MARFVSDAPWAVIITRRRGRSVRPIRNRQDADVTRVIERSFGNALGAEMVADQRVMNEFAQDGEGALAGESFGLGDGVADAETDAEMLGTRIFTGREGEDHRLCRTKLFRKKIHFFPALMICSSTPR